MQIDKFISKFDTGYYLTTTLYMYHYNQDLIVVLLNSDIGYSMNIRSDIRKNHLGIWELCYHEYMTNYKFTKSEIITIRKEIKKYNDYECRNTRLF